MNKASLASELAGELNIPKVRATIIVNTLFGLLHDTLVEGTKITISDFGTFNLTNRKAFKGINPKTGASIDVPSRKVVVFRSGKALRNALNAE
jgi:nucleoid DNA-binding protein